MRRADLVRSARTSPRSLYLFLPSCAPDAHSLPPTLSLAPALRIQCPECHAEVSDHPLAKTTEMAFMCKKCRKAFRKDMSKYEEADEYCPHCDNHYVRRRNRFPLSRVLASRFRGPDGSSCGQVIEAKTPNAMLGVESEDTRVDNRCVTSSSLWRRVPPRSLLRGWP